LKDLVGAPSPFIESSKKEEVIATINEYLNNYISLDGFATQILSECYAQNSLQLEDNVVFHFPVRTDNNLEDLFASIMNPTNCRSSKVSLPAKDNSDFTTLEPVYVYTHVIKPNLVGDSYVRLLTTLHFPYKTGYDRFDYPLHRPVQQSFTECIAIRQVTKTGEDVAFD
jgi:hypothetical protein